MISNKSTNGGSGAILIIPDVPLGLDLGINCISFETGPKFRGMSVIPQGLHFIYHSTGMAARQGFFWRTDGHDVSVRRWDPVEEHICASDNLSPESIATLIQELRRGDLNNNLGPYPVAQHHIWLNLSCFIHEKVLLRANCPAEEIIYPSEAHDLASLVIPSSSSKSSTDKFEDKSRKTDKKFILQGNYAQFVNLTAAEVRLRDQINRTTTPANRPGELTALFIDKSLLLDDLLENEYDSSWENILGEMQLSFILFLLIFCYDALEHWKKLVDAVCRSERFLISKPDFAVAFMRILYEQLNFSPSDFFANELSKDNFLRPAISVLFENLRQERGVLETSVLEHRRRLIKFFQKKFNLFHDHGGQSTLENTQLSCDDLNLVDEDLPMIVDFSEIDASNCRNGEEGKGVDSKELHADAEFENPEKDALSGHPSGTKSPMTSMEIESQMYCWRYPNLYDSIVLGGLNEDFEMAASRILSESDDPSENIGVTSETLKLAKFESKMFLEDEARRR